MIQISLTHALAFYSAVLSILIIAIWVYTELTVRRHQKFLQKQFLWRCVFCSYTYLDEGAENVSQCPRCQSFNSVDDKRARFVPKSPAAQRAAAQSVVAAPAHRNPSRRKRPHQRRRGPKKR